MVYSRLGRRLRALGLSSFKDYLALLENGDAAEWEAFTNSLTTNLTAFFREEHHFPILAEHVQKRKSRAADQLWCSAASTGEEPYSMAMTAVEAFGTLTPPVQILATDIDTNVLATAAAGRLCHGAAGENAAGAAQALFPARQRQPCRLGTGARRNCAT